MESARQPLVRLVWLPGWRLSIGVGSYYGWRWWVNVGPLVILIGRAAPEDAR